MAATIGGRCFIPALPTLWPGMLLGKEREVAFHPFRSPAVRYFYLARNAVWLAAKALRLDRGEVLVPAYHHGVEVEALLDAGAQVRFYRVGPRWDVDLEDVERKIGSRTKALYFIHYAGFPGPVAQMKALASRHGLPLIEDCALSLLSAEGAQPLGSTGDISIFCLYKTLPVPNGGALTTNGPRSYSIPEPPPPPFSSTFGHVTSSMLQNLELRAGVAGRVLRAMARGMGRSARQAARIEHIPTGTQHFRREHVGLGMSAVSRRIVLAQDMEGIVERRRRNYFFLLGRLRELAAPMFAELAPGVCPLFYPLVVGDKDRVLARLRARGIEAIDFWRHFHPACDAASFSDVARLRERVVEIPCHQDLTPELMSGVVDVVREALDAEPRWRPAAARLGGQMRPLRE